MAQGPVANPSTDIPEQNQRANEEATEWLDSVDISLLTCGPGQEVWSYYGHTALRIQDKAHHSDVAVNWGMFSFRQSFFILRFVFGLTDYQIGIYPMSDFLAEYAAEGRWVRQQRIRLSKEEKLNILRAIAENDKPENRTYRYNFFYDNCTTRAREMVLTSIGYDKTNFSDVNTHSTYRQEIHKLNQDHRWARFGNDLLLGALADRSLVKREWEFLPDNLSKDFETEGRKDIVESATPMGAQTVASSDYITLIDSTCYLIEPQHEAKVAEDCITPNEIGACILLIVILVCIFEIYSRKNLWWIDTILLTLTGLPGLILLAMIFSQHPTVQINFQILILNPLNLIFVWQASKQMRKGKLPLYYEVWGLMLITGLLLQIWQSYAEGMNLLALSLLARYAVKSTLLDLGNSKFGLQAFVFKKIYRANKKKLNTK